MGRYPYAATVRDACKVFKRVGRVKTTQYVINSMRAELHKLERQGWRLRYAILDTGDIILEVDPKSFCIGWRQIDEQ
jgi:hypothetical protein